MKDREEPRPEKELDSNGAHYNGLYGETSPERGTFFRLQTYERVVISLAEVYEREGQGNLCHLSGL